MKKNSIFLISTMVLLCFASCNATAKKADKKTNKSKETVMATTKTVEERLAGKKGLYAAMETKRGTIILELFYKKTPLTVTNFVGLAEGTLDAADGEAFYDGLNFHRVISKANGDGQDFMIQGGDPKGNGTGGPGYRFGDEILPELTFSKPGLLAMANAGPGTNGSQFFITIVPTEWLNGNHTIFGEVIDAESQEIVNCILQGDRIESVKIYRLGADAEKFTASQKDFDKLASELQNKIREAKEKEMADQIAAVEKAFTGFAKDENGIYFKTIKEGSGEKCGEMKNVSTEYKGYFINGDVFDQSAGRGPLDFTTGAGQMIPGFDVMVQDMKVGEKRTIVLPPSMAYGERGAGGVIPGNTYIAFDIELVSAK